MNARRRRRRRLIAPAVIWGMTAGTLAASGWGQSVQPATTTPTTESTVATSTTAARQDNPYLKFEQYPNGTGRLMSSIVTMQDQAGREVALVSAVHVGDLAYYRKLSAALKTYDAVLYELVAPDGAIPHAGDTNHGGVSMLQHMLKNVLGLSFQLDAIDYSAGNFVHADLDADTFAQMQEARGESLMGLMLQSVIDQMLNPSSDEPPELQSARLFAALVSPDRPRQLKLLLAGQFEDLDAKIENLQGPDGSVLLTERNKRAIETLTKELAGGKKKLAIFYGAAHMRDMQKRVEELGFHVVEGKWLTAWDMTQLPATRATTLSAP